MAPANLVAHFVTVDPASKQRTAKGKTCHACNKQNHFSKVCRSKYASSGQKPASREHVNTTKTNFREGDRSSSDEYVYTVSEQISVVTSNRPEVKIKINSVPIPVLVDSGPSVNVLARHHYEQIAAQESLNLQRTKIVIYPYGSRKPLPLLGKLDTVVESELKLANASFYVVNSNHESLLCYTTAEELGLIKVTQPVHSVSTQPEAAVDYDQLVNEYTDIF